MWVQSSSMLRMILLDWLTKGENKSRVCSFCHKSEDGVGQLFDAPKDYIPRAHICDECVNVSNRVLTRANVSMQSGTGPHAESLDNHLFLLVSDWLDLDSRGEDTSEILQQMKVAARELLAKNAEQERD